MPDQDQKISARALAASTLEQLPAAIEAVEKLGSAASSTAVERCQAVEALANAAVALDSLARREVLSAPAPPFDVDALIGRVWQATQEAGGSTATGDAAVAAIREVVGR